MTRSNSHKQDDDSKYNRDDDYGPNEDGNDQMEPDQFEPDEFESDPLPVGPDEGAIPARIPEDPEHDRVIDPAERAHTPPLHSIKFVRLP